MSQEAYGANEFQLHTWMNRACMEAGQTQSKHDYRLDVDLSEWS